MDRLPSILSPLVLCLALVLFGTGCGVKRKLEAETVEVRNAINEKKAILKRAEAESATIGHLGRYDSPRPEHLTELKARIESLKRDSLKLAEEREAKKESLAAIQAELASYQSKFPTN